MVDKLNGFLLGFRVWVTRRFRCSTRGIKDQVSWGTLDESVNPSRTDLNNDLNAASKLLYVFFTSMSPGLERGTGTGNKNSARSKDASASFKLDIKGVFIKEPKQLAELAEVGSVVIIDDTSVRNGVVTVIPRVVAGLPVSFWGEATDLIRLTETGGSEEPVDLGLEIPLSTESRSKLSEGFREAQKLLRELFDNASEASSVLLQSFGKRKYIVSLSGLGDRSLFVDKSPGLSGGVFGAILSVLLRGSIGSCKVSPVSNDPLPRFKVGGVFSLDISLDMQSSISSSFDLMDMIFICSWVQTN